MPPRKRMTAQSATRRVHRSAEEIEALISMEVTVKDNEIKPPSFIRTIGDEEEFYQLAQQLCDNGLYTALDADTLGRYVQSKRFYDKATSILSDLLENSAPIANIQKAQSVQDRAFKQCHTCATALGLTVTARAKLIIPTRDDDEDYEL